MDAGKTSEGGMFVQCPHCYRTRWAGSPECRCRLPAGQELPVAEEVREEEPPARSKRPGPYRPN